jgi:hypothetical protein
MQSFNYLSIAIFALLIVACQSAPMAGGDSSGLPQWVTELPIKKGFAYGVGSAPVSSDEATAAQLARQRARFDLIKGLQVNVSGEFYSSTELNNTELTQTVRQTIRNRVDETELTQIEILDSYFDKKKRVVYVLAELNRLTVARQLSREINEIDLSLDVFKPAGRDRLENIQSYLPIVKKIENRDQIIKKIMLVSGKDYESTDDGLADKILFDFGQMLSDLVVGLAPLDRVSEALTNGIAEQLTQQGFTIGQDNYDLIISYKVAQQLREQDSIYYSFALGEATLTDSSGNVIKQVSKQVKAASSYADSASKQALTKLAEYLGSVAVSALLGREYDSG